MRPRMLLNSLGLGGPISPVSIGSHCGHVQSCTVTEMDYLPLNMVSMLNTNL